SSSSSTLRHENAFAPTTVTPTRTLVTPRTRQQSLVTQQHRSAHSLPTRTRQPLTVTLPIRVVIAEFSLSGNLHFETCLKVSFLPPRARRARRPETPLAEPVSINTL